MKPTDSWSENERLVYKWFTELFNRGDLAVADEILAPAVRYHGPASLTPGDVSGPAAIKEYVEVYQRAFPDIWYTVEHIFGGADEICVRWVATGTHESDLFSLESTGETFEEAGINAFALEDGLITDVWSQWDTLRMVQELGIVPPVGATEP